MCTSSVFLLAVELPSQWWVNIWSSRYEWSSFCWTSEYDSDVHIYLSTREKEMRRGHFHGWSIGSTRQYLMHIYCNPARIVCAVPNLVRIKEGTIITGDENIQREIIARWVQIKRYKETNWQKHARKLPPPHWFWYISLKRRMNNWQDQSRMMKLKMRYSCIGKDMYV